MVHPGAVRKVSMMGEGGRGATHLIATTSMRIFKAKCTASTQGGEYGSHLERQVLTDSTISKEKMKTGLGYEQITIAKVKK